jgi:type II secretory ATPase GspE/PulE/Tfp pilus assembly ATPase PilB-like protein
MGVEPFLVVQLARGGLAQRLVRVICRDCKEEYIPEHPATLPPDFEYKAGEKLYRGTGCRECRGTGFSGRRALFELLIMTDELREMVVNRQSASQMLPIAVEKNKMRLLRDDGWILARQGKTTVEEVLRVTKA